MIPLLACLLTLSLVSCVGLPPQDTQPAKTQTPPSQTASPVSKAAEVPYVDKPVENVDALGISHHVATQYWTWYTAGAQATMWDGVKDGIPTAGYYSSYDPAVAATHISAMLANGIDVLSYGFLNQAGDQTMWDRDRIDNDRAFREGAMKASNFKSIKFNVGYDLATRAMLVHQAENGLQWGKPEGSDILPGVKFFEPGVDAGPTKFDFPSFDFNLRDAGGAYIYDELLSYDFKYLAENYFNQPNYLTVDGAPVVFLYASWRYNNSGSGGDADAFARALLRVRNEVYEKYGLRLYIVGDFVSYYNKGRIASLTERGYFGNYDAITGWNVYDDVYRGAFGDWTRLDSYTDVSKRVQEDFLSAAKIARRSYRDSLGGKAKTAYGPSTTSVDYLPVLSFSFRRHSLQDGFKAERGEDLVKELNMVKSLRERSQLAEEKATLVYQIAWNQWNEGQIIEPSVYDAKDTYPARTGTEYLRRMAEILGGGAR